MRKRFSHQRCFVVGSAPKIQLAPHDRCICVNGSGWSAARLGIVIPDLTVIAGFTLRGTTPVRSATIDALAGLRTKTALLIDFGLPLNEAIRVLQSIGYSFDELLTVSSAERAEIFAEICGMPVPSGDYNKRPSNGLFAVALALWGGAANVTMSGFSLAGGHAYMSGETPRHHVEGDKWFISQTRSHPIVFG